MTMQFPAQLSVNLLPETKALIQQATALREAGQTITITDTDSYKSAADQLQVIKGLAKRLDTDRKSITKPIDDLKAEVMDFYRPATTALTDAETLIKKAINAYDHEQDRIRRAQEAAAAEAARKEREKLEAQAAKAEAAGKTERAELLQERAASVVAAPVAIAEPPKVEGVSKRVTYKAVVVDVMALVKAVAAGTVPVTVLVPDQAALNRMANALKGQLNYPGVTVEAETVISSRSK